MLGRDMLIRCPPGTRFGEPQLTKFRAACRRHTTEPALIADVLASAALKGDMRAPKCACLRRAPGPDAWPQAPWTTSYLKAHSYSFCRLNRRCTCSETACCTVPSKKALERPEQLPNMMRDITPSCSARDRKHMKRKHGSTVGSPSGRAATRCNCGARAASVGWPARLQTHCRKAALPAICRGIRPPAAGIPDADSNDTAAHASSVVSIMTEKTFEGTANACAPCAGGSVHTAHYSIFKWCLHLKHFDATREGAPT